MQRKTIEITTKNTKMNTENNKKIALFMGFTEKHVDVVRVPKHLQIEFQAIVLNVADLKYDKDWSWLMPVAQKVCEAFPELIRKSGKFDPWSSYHMNITSALCSFDMPPLYGALVTAINAINQQTK